MGLIIFREKWCHSQLMQMVIKVHYLYQSSIPKIPGWQIPIRFRVDGNQFTTPLFLVLNYWLCYVVLQMYILKKKTSHLKSSYSASWGPITVCNYIALLFYMSIVTDPYISAYWSKSSLYCGLWSKHIMSQSQYKQMELLKNTDWTLGDTNNDKLTKIRRMYNVIKFRTN